MSRLLSLPRTTALVALLVLLVWAARVDVPRLTGGIKGDEATYVSMALSLANDGDLKYRAEDYQRFQAAFHTGPNGIFLKRGPLSPDQALDYGKPFAYSVAAAPLVKLFGINGLLIFNLLLLMTGLLCAVSFGRARIGGTGGAVVGAAFIGASAIPIYAAWLTPEIFNCALVLVAYFLWWRTDIATTGGTGRRLSWVSAFLLGVATFSKASNVLLVGPLVVVALIRRRWIQAFGIIAMFAMGSAGLFGVNKMVSGDWNYQGGDRRYFSGPRDFPFDGHGTTFAAGSEMRTEEANDENILAPRFVQRMLPRNTMYFFLGRDAGLLPYYFPGVLILLWWVMRARRAPMWQWAICLVWLGSCLGLLLITPGSWNGGGGPIGNRYFISMYPAMLFLLPTARNGWLAALASAVVGLTCVGAMLLHPFAASHAVWLNPERWPLRLLPVELTIMENLPVRLNHDRARIEVSTDPEVFLYYMDSNTYFQEKDGFWVAGGATADIVIRTEVPLTRLDLRVHAPIANDVEISIDGRTSHESLQPNEEKTVQLRPKPGVYANTSYQILWRITTRAGFYPKDLNPASTDPRHLGVFIKPTYAVK